MEFLASFLLFLIHSFHLHFCVLVCITPLSFPQILPSYSSKFIHKQHLLLSTSFPVLTYSCEKTCYLHVHIFLIYLSPTCSIQKNNASLIQQKKYIFPQFGHKIQARFSARFITSIPCLTSGTDPSPFPLCSRLPKRTLAYQTATLVYCFKTRDF